jgi:hypothetical protein
VRSARCGALAALTLLVGFYLLSAAKAFGLHHLPGEESLEGVDGRRSRDNPEGGMSAYRDAADRVLCEEEGVRLTATALTLPDGTTFPLETAEPSTVSLERTSMGWRLGIRMLGISIGLVAAAPGHRFEALFVPALLLLMLAPWIVPRPHRVTLQNGDRTASHAFRSGVSAQRMMDALRQLLPAAAPLAAPARAETGAAPKAVTKPVLHLESVHPPPPRQSLGSLNLAAKHRIHPSSSAESGGYARVLLGDEKHEEPAGDEEAEGESPASGDAAKS